MVQGRRRGLRRVRMMQIATAQAIAHKRNPAQLLGSGNSLRCYRYMPSLLATTGVVFAAVPRHDGAAMRRYNMFYTSVVSWQTLPVMRQTALGQGWHLSPGQIRRSADDGVFGSPPNPFTGWIQPLLRQDPGQSAGKTYPRSLSTHTDTLSRRCSPHFRSKLAD